MTDANLPTSDRAVFCNRTLNLRSIGAIGYDMDYTLVHYRVEAWEQRAYEHLKQKLGDQGWPVGELAFDPTVVARGLIIDTELGNVIKVNRFGYVKQARHGTTDLAFDNQRRLYSRMIVDLHDPRFRFLNTLFSLSEACMFCQLVDQLDDGGLPQVLGYRDLYDIIRNAIDETHVEGLLKSEIIESPERFVERDPDTALALLDQRHAGKRLILITNSEWFYTQAMMSYTMDPFLPTGQTWRDLFEIIIISARKPSFFSDPNPFFEVINDDGDLRPCIRHPPAPGIYLGGNASGIEEYLQLAGDRILYVGDHIFADVKVSKSALRWRTALILRELEGEVVANREFGEQRSTLQELMRQKEAVEADQNQLRLELQRAKARYGPRSDRAVMEIEQELGALRRQLLRLDERISPLAEQSGHVSHPFWGPIMRAGNDKSHMARQVEHSADVYTSRVSNFLFHTPFVYWRSPRGSLPHDP